MMLTPLSFVLDDFSDSKRVRQYVDFFELERAFEAEVTAETHFEEDAKRGHAVNPANTEPYPPKWDDLARLHWLTRARRAVAVTEFGAGYSTSVIAHALRLNKQEFGEWALTNRRIQSPFTVLTVDQSDYWLEQTIQRTDPLLREYIRPWSSAVIMGDIEGRACTFYKDLPNFVADLVFLDGPDQYAPENNVRGFSTGSPSLMPMAGDLLVVEHFFEPGAVIVVDGRTANARFLASNFQRGWRHHHFSREDFHLFELSEAPLGRINLARLEQLSPLFRE